MTAHFIAKVVQSQFDKVDFDSIASKWKGINKIDCGRMSDEWVNAKIEDDQYYRWIKACYLLEEYIKRNYESFDQTELVYLWAKNLCIMKNNDLNKWKQYGGYKTFKEYYNNIR